MRGICITSGRCMTSLSCGKNQMTDLVICSHSHCNQFFYYIFSYISFSKIEAEVKALQASRGDYQHWYYIPPETQTYQVIQQDVYEMEQERSFGR